MSNMNMQQKTSLSHTNFYNVLFINQAKERSVGPRNQAGDGVAIRGNLRKITRPVASVRSC